MSSSIPMLEDLLQRQPYNAVSDFVDANVARGRGGKIAFTDTGRSLTFGELQARTWRLAAALRSLGVRAENCVILLLPDSVDHPVAFWGTIRAGVVPVPMNTLLTVEQYTLPVQRQPRRCRDCVAAARKNAVVDPRPATRPAHDHRGRSECTRTGGPARRHILRRHARGLRRHAVYRIHHVGRGRVLDVHVGLDRQTPRRYGTFTPAP